MPVEGIDLEIAFRKMVIRKTRFGKDLGDLHTFTQLIASSVRLISDTGKLHHFQLTSSTPLSFRIVTHKFLAVSNIKPR